MADRFIKTFNASRITLDYTINNYAKDNGLSIVSASISSDHSGGIYATVVFEEKPKPSKKKGGTGNG